MITHNEFFLSIINSNLSTSRIRLTIEKLCAKDQTWDFICLFAKEIRTLSINFEIYIVPDVVSAHFLKNLEQNKFSICLLTQFFQQ